MPVSVLSSLEPLFGASLAVNLAYLNLNQFRYRDKIASQAKQKIADAPETVHQTEWFKEIESLANQGLDAPVPLKLPGSVWGWIYRPLFHWQFDKMMSVLFTVVSALYLYIGVAHSVGMLSNFQEPFTPDRISNELTYATLGLCWPMMMVLAAKFCTFRCNKFIQYQLNNIKRTVLEDGSADIDEATAQLDAKAKAKT